MTLCKQKHRYETRREDEESAALINATLAGQKRRLRVHICRICRGFHLTTQKPRRKAA